MPDKLLKEIKEIDSVEVVAVVSFKGNIWKQMGNAIDAQRLKMLATYLLRIFAVKSKKRERLVHTELHWMNRFLLARFSEGFLILVVFKKVDALALLRITLNVTVANLLEEKSFLKWLKNEKYSVAYHLQKGAFNENELSLISKLV